VLLIIPNTEKLAQNAARTTSHALSPPSGKLSLSSSHSFSMLMLSTFDRNGPWGFVVSVPDWLETGCSGVFTVAFLTLRDSEPELELATLLNWSFRQLSSAKLDPTGFIPQNSVCCDPRIYCITQ